MFLNHFLGCPFLLRSISDAFLSGQIAKLGWRQVKEVVGGKNAYRLSTVASVLSGVYLSIDSFGEPYRNTQSMPTSGMGSGTSKAKKTQVLSWRAQSLLRRERETHGQIIKILCRKHFIRRTIKVLGIREERRDLSCKSRWCLSSSSGRCSTQTRQQVPSPHFRNGKYTVANAVGRISI